MEELCNLRWRQIGLEKMENGSIEPLFERRNPNRAIQELVSKYNDFAVPSLALLQRDIFSNYYPPQDTLNSNSSTNSNESNESTINYSLKRENSLNLIPLHHLPPSLYLDPTINENKEENDDGNVQFHDLDQLPDYNPNLTLSASLISLPDDWPTLDRCTTTEFKKFAEDLNGL